MKTYGKTYEFTDATAEVFRWVALAAGKDETRYFMEQRIHVEGGQAVATDGRRMHMAEVPRQRDKVGEEWIESDVIEPGDYQIVQKSTKKITLAKLGEKDGQFPNYKKVIPEGEPVLVVDYDAPAKKREDEFTVGVAVLIIKAGKHAVLNHEYLRDLTPGAWKAEFRSHGDKPGTAVWFKMGARSAVIMPMYLDNYL